MSNVDHAQDYIDNKINKFVAWGISPSNHRPTIFISSSSIRDVIMHQFGDDIRSPPTKSKKLRDLVKRISLWLDKEYGYLSPSKKLIDAEMIKEKRRCLAEKEMLQNNEREQLLSKGILFVGDDNINLTYCGNRRSVKISDTVRVGVKVYDDKKTCLVFDTEPCALGNVLIIDIERVTGECLADLIRYTKKDSTNTMQFTYREWLDYNE
jgi:hypothetical protein